MELTVRSLTVADVGIVEDLSSQALSTLTERRGGVEFLERFSSLRGIEASELEHQLAQDHREVLVGLLDGQVFAVALMGIDESVLTVEGLYVDPEAREVGLGTALMHAAEQRARELGCERLEALALPGDRRMKQRAESQAMKARLLVLSKALEQRQ